MRSLLGVFWSILALLLCSGCSGPAAGKTSDGKAATGAADEAAAKASGSTGEDSEKKVPEETKPEPKPEPEPEPEPEENVTASKQSVVKVKRLLRRWTSEVAEDREEAWQGLKEMGDLATPALVEVVKTGKPQMKRFAITAIGLLKDKLGSEALRAALSDADAGVRWSAARALGEIGDTGAKELLAKAVREDTDPEVRYHAAYALAGMGGESAFAFFREQVKSDKVDDRSRAVRALGKYAASKHMAELTGALKDTESRVRYAAVIQLDRSRRKEAVPGLMAALKDGDRNVRKRARSALERLTGQELGSDTEKWQEWWKKNGATFKPAAGPAKPAPVKFAEAGTIAGEADFKRAVTDSKGLVLVDFYTARGKDCARFAPVFDKLAKEYKGRAAFHAAEARANMAIIRKLRLRRAPTTVVFKDGNKVETIGGFKDEAALRKVIDEHLAGTRKPQEEEGTKLKFPDVKDAAEFKAKATDVAGVVLVDFHEDWCGWCQKLKPVLNKLSEEMKGKVSFVAVNTGKCKDIKEKFAIQVWPTMVVLKDGKEVERIKGFKPADELRTILEKHLGGAAGGDGK
jgi:thioredoxin